MKTPPMSVDLSARSNRWRQPFTQSCETPHGARYGSQNGEWRTGKNGCKPSRWTVFVVFVSDSAPIVRPWNAPAKENIYGFLVCHFIILYAASMDSVPEFERKTRPLFSGEGMNSRSVSQNSTGSRAYISRKPQCMPFFSCSCMALTTEGFELPTLFTAMPAAKSRYLRSSTS